MLRARDASDVGGASAAKDCDMARRATLCASQALSCPAIVLCPRTTHIMILHVQVVKKSVPGPRLMYPAEPRTRPSINGLVRVAC